MPAEHQPAHEVLQIEQVALEKCHLAHRPGKIAASYHLLLSIHHSGIVSLIWKGLQQQPIYFTPQAI